MKYSFYIRNHWRAWHMDRWYLFGLGFHIQGVRLVVWQLWILGFCICLFVENKDPRPRPFPMSMTDWVRRVKRTRP